MNEKTFNIRLPESEFQLLARYAAQTGRTKSEIVREFIRSLEPKQEMRGGKGEKAEAVSVIAASPQQ